MRSIAALEQELLDSRPRALGDDMAKVCMLHLPANIKRAIHSHRMVTFKWLSVVFKNGHEVAFRSSWKEFVAECILVHDLPPIER